MGAGSRVSARETLFRRQILHDGGPRRIGCNSPSRWDCQRNIKNERLTSPHGMRLSTVGDPPGRVGAGLFLVEMNSPLVHAPCSWLLILRGGDRCGSGQNLPPVRSSPCSVRMVKPAHTLPGVTRREASPALARLGFRRLSARTQLRRRFSASPRVFATRQSRPSRYPLLGKVPWGRRQGKSSGVAC